MKEGRMAIVFEAPRDGYSIDQVADSVMTVGELIGLLSDYDEERLIVISHDNGYTYGGLEFKEEVYEQKDGEWA